MPGETLTPSKRQDAPDSGAGWYPVGMTKNEFERLRRVAKQQSVELALLL
jgi:DNA-binding CsgD family transcriptional regulator